jgi:hypothetical protein
MTSKFISESAVDGFAITPNDSADMAAVAVQVYVGVAGNMVVDTTEGTTLTFIGLQAGQILPVKCRRVRATGTTATNLIGLTVAS